MNTRKKTGRILWKVVMGELNPVRGVRRLPKRNDAYAETWRRRLRREWLARAVQRAGRNCRASRRNGEVHSEWDIGLEGEGAGKLV